MLNSLPFKNYTTAALSISLVTIILGILAQRVLPPEIPLFYGLPEGEEQIGSSLMIVIPPLSALVITSLNAIISYFWEDEFLRKTLVIASMAVTFFATITTIKIILLVGSF